MRRKDFSLLTGVLDGAHDPPRGVHLALVDVVLQHDAGAEIEDVIDAPVMPDALLLTFLLLFAAMRGSNAAPKSSQNLLVYALRKPNSSSWLGWIEKAKQFSIQHPATELDAGCVSSSARITKKNKKNWLL